MPELSNPQAFLAIILVAIGTYALRFGGLVLHHAFPKLVDFGAA